MLENKKLGILQDIANNGGKRLEQIDTEIKQHEKYKDDKKKDYDDYEKIRQAMRPTLLPMSMIFMLISVRAKRYRNCMHRQEDELKQQRDNLIK